MKCQRCGRSFVHERCYHFCPVAESTAPKENPAMWSIEINWNGRWVQVNTGFKSRDDAEWATGKWKQSNQCYGDPFRTVEAPDPALDFATDAMHGPKDEADPLEADRRSEAAMSDLRFCEGCSQPEWNPHLEGCPVAAAPMSPEEQEKALAHLDAAFEADRQKVISEVMGMAGDKPPILPHVDDDAAYAALCDKPAPIPPRRLAE